MSLPLPVLPADAPLASPVYRKPEMSGAFYRDRVGEVACAHCRLHRLVARYRSKGLNPALAPCPTGLGYWFVFKAAARPWREWMIAPRNYFSTLPGGTCTCIAERLPGYRERAFAIKQEREDGTVLDRKPRRQRRREPGSAWERAQTRVSARGSP